MKRILYEGYYGYKSVGDDSFVEVTAWGANKIWGVNNNYFLSNDLPITQNKVKSLNTQKIRGQNKMEILYQLIKTDTFISSGGSTFEITYPKYHIRNIALRKKKISKKYKIGAIGVSIGPFKSKKDEYNTIHYLKNIDFLALRDNRSFELVQGIDLPYRAIKAFDLAALISNIYDRRRSESNRSMKIIGISINYFERYRPGYNIENEKKRIAYIEEIIYRLAKYKEIILRIIEFNGNDKVGDKEINCKIINKLYEKGCTNVEYIPYNKNVQFMYSKIQECDIILSSRLHAAIFACFSNIPFFLIEYHKKCEDFLTDIGYNENYRIYDGKKEINKLMINIEDILHNNKSYIYPCYIEECKQRALCNFTSIKI